MQNGTQTIAATPVAPEIQREAVAVLSRAPQRRRGRWRVAAVTALSVAIVGYALLPYLAFDPSTVRVGLRAGVPWHYPILLIHVLTGGVALLLGPWQFVRRIRRVPRVHRYIGRTYLFAGVFPASVTGMVVAWLSTAGPVAWAAFTLMDVVWFGTAFIGYRTIRARRYRDHERWMIRAFAVTFAAVTLRVWLATLILAQLPWLDSRYGGDFDALFLNAYLASAWLSLIGNLLVVEFYLWRRGAPRAKSAVPALP